MDENTLKEMEKVKVTATAQDLWEPAAPGETLENIWIPNRRERRKMLSGKGVKKNKKRAMKTMGQLLQAAEKSTKESPEFKREIYKALYENLQKMTEGIEEKLEQKNREEQAEKEKLENGTTEGN